MATQDTLFRGARYLVKFDGNWVQSKSYEAITSVQYNGFTYLSKQPVPAGTIITNTDFWLLWADPNAQMEQLREIVESYSDDIEALENGLQSIQSEIEDNGCIAFFGDSWSDEKNDGDNPWPKRVSEKLNMTKINCAIAGTGFVVGSNENAANAQNFLGQSINVFPQKLQEANKTYDDVKIIVVVGGVNDFRYGYSYNDMIPYATDFFNQLITVCPHARIIFAGINTGVFITMDNIPAGSNKRANYDDFPAFNRNFCNFIKNRYQANWGVEVIENFWWWLCSFGADMKNVFKDDLLHPSNTYGQAIIANNMLAVINGSYHNYSEVKSVVINSPVTINYNDADGAQTIQATLNAEYSVNDTVVHIEGQIELPETINPTAHSTFDIPFSGTGKFGVPKNQAIYSFDFAAQHDIGCYVGVGEYNNFTTIFRNNRIRFYLRSGLLYRSIYFSGSYNVY